MNVGLTIAFISGKKSHATNTNYNKFGNKYWDDADNNNSQIGYYFVYYYQKKYVYVHKIINITQPNIRPQEMQDWSSNNNTIYLSRQLIKLTWDEWITNIGKGAPYTRGNYRSCRTTSWSYNDLQRKYNEFNLTNFVNIVEKINYKDDSKIIKEENTKIRPILVIQEIDEEEENIRKKYDVIMEEKRKIEEKMVEHKRQKIIQIREKRNADIDKEIVSKMEIIKSLQLEIDVMNYEKLANTNGENDEFLMKLLK
jgi:hypothetical protein